MDLVLVVDNDFKDNIMMTYSYSPTFCFHGRPRQATDVLQPAGLLYRPLWTFKLWPPHAPAPTDAFRTLAAEVGTYGRGIRTGNFA
jgi:hypothetical protein